jgi:Domain of unknown function (DUF4157)
MTHQPTNQTKAPEHVHASQTSNAAKSAAAPAMHPILQLQQQMGNRAVGRLIQAKLTVGEANDAYEQEASQNEKTTLQKSNDTGLPNNLKVGIEALSGYSMDNVRVHYNSSKPAEVQALAYAQGTEIHLAPGQEKHLPHEAWHVVQQAQGRVQPTMQMKNGVPVNDDAGLEHEADVMGAKALEPTTEAHEPRPHLGDMLRSRASSIALIQRVWDDEGEWWINKDLTLKVYKQTGQVFSLDNKPIIDWNVYQAVLRDLNKESEKIGSLRMTGNAMKKWITEVGKKWDVGEGQLCNKSRCWTLRLADNVLLDVDGNVLNDTDTTEALNSLEANYGSLVKTIRSDRKAAKKLAKPAKPAAAPIDWLSVLSIVEVEYVVLLEWAVEKCPAALIPNVDIDHVEWILENARSRIESTQCPPAWMRDLTTRLVPLCAKLRHFDNIVQGYGAAARLAERQRQIENAAVQAKNLFENFSELIKKITMLSQVSDKIVIGTIVWQCRSDNKVAEMYLKRLAATLPYWSKVKGLEEHFRKMLRGGGKSALAGAVPEVEVAAKQVKAKHQGVVVGEHVAAPGGGKQEIDVQSTHDGLLHLVEVKADVSALVVKHLVKFGKKYQLDVLLLLACQPNTRVTIECCNATGWARLWYSGYMSRLLLLWNDNAELNFIIAGQNYSRATLVEINRIMLVQMEFMSFEQWVRREMEMDLKQPRDLLKSGCAHRATAEGASTMKSNLNDANRPSNRKRSASL